MAVNWEHHLRRQPNAWSCGPAALRHALLVYGHRVDVRRIAALTHTTCCNEGGPKDGTCEHGLDKAARVFGYRLGHALARDPGEVYRVLREQPVPTLLSTEHASHWITTVGRATSRHVWIADSERGSLPILQRLTWRELCRRVVYGLADEATFHLYPLVES